MTYRALFGLREFRWLFAAGSCTIAGGTVKMLALSATVYAQTGSPLLAALAYLGGFLPQGIGAVTLLSFADRLRPRATLVGWQVVQAAVALCLAAGVLPTWGMLALILLVGLGDSVVGGVGSAVMVDVLTAEAYILGRSILNVNVGAMQIVGFAAGGALIAATGTTVAFLAAAGLSLTASALNWIGLRRRPPRARGPASVAATWRGNRALFGRRETRRLILAQWLPNGLIVGAEAMFVPYAGGAAGALFAAAAGGMMLGDLAIGRWTSRAARVRLTAPLYGLLALPYLAFVWRPGAVAATVLVAIASIGFAGTLTVQERFLASLPENLLGQGIGLVGNGMMTMQAVSAAAAGGIAELTGPGLAMTITATASLAATAALCLRPSPTANTEPMPVTPS